MLEVKNLQKHFNDLVVFDNFSLTVRRGGFTVLVGPSGCGKSTFFDVLTGAVKKDGGDILWDGEIYCHLGRQGCLHAAEGSAPALAYSY